MKDEIKSIKGDISYIKSSVEGWVKFGSSYNYDMVIKTIDVMKDKIEKLKTKHFSTDQEVS